MKKLVIFAAAILAFAACVKDGIYPYVSFSGLENTIAYDEKEDVTVSVKATALLDITEVNLVYSVNDGEQKTIPMTLDGKKYTAVIPAQAMDSVINYFVEAKTADATSKSAVVSYTVGVIPIDFSPLKLNELNGQEKFIEIINTGKDDIDLKGVYIEKDGATKWTGVSGLVIKAGQFMLLYSSDVTSTGKPHEGYDEKLVFSGGLSAKKAVRIQLFDPKGNSLDDFNLVTLKISEAPASYSRVPDGTGPWCYTDATPGAKNAPDKDGPVF